MKIIFSLILLLYSFGLFSQTPENHDELKQKESYEPSRFFDNVYFDAAVGTQILFSKDVENLSFKNRFTPMLSLSIGKWFSPVFGVGLQVQGTSLNGFSTVDRMYSASQGSGYTYNNDPVRDYVTINPDGTYRHFIHYTNISIDFHVSLFNLINGRDRSNKFDVIPSLGFGNMCVSQYKGIPRKNTFSTHVGLMGKYHLAPKLDLNIKANTVFFANDFEGRVAGNATNEKYVAVGIGLTYVINKRGFKKKYKHVEIPVIDQVVEKEVVREVALKEEVVRAVDTVNVLKKTPKEQAETIIKKINLAFNLGSIEPCDKSNDEKLKELTVILKNNPGFRLHIIGHTCDLGSYVKNLKIGMERANTIKENLMKLGIPASCLIAESKSFSEPLLPNINDENRIQNRRVELKLD